MPDDRIEPLIEAFERGEEVVLMRAGKPLAQLVAVPITPDPRPMSPKAIDDMLDIWDRLPGPPIDAARLIREMRDEDY